MVNGELVLGISYWVLGFNIFQFFHKAMVYFLCTS